MIDHIDRSRLGDEVFQRLCQQFGFAQADALRRTFDLLAERINAVLVSAKTNAKSNESVSGSSQAKEGAKRAAAILEEGGGCIDLRANFCSGL